MNAYLDIIKLLGVIIVPIVLSVFPFVVESRISYLIFLSFIYIVLAQSINIALLAGTVNLGVHGIFGLGAYIFTLLRLHNISVLGSVVFSGAMAVLLLSPFLILLKLRGAYLAIATLVLPLLISSLIILTPEQTGGARGLFLSSINEPYLLSYYIAFITVIILHTTLKLLYRSKYKFALDAIFDDIEVASSLGINVYRYKVIFFTMSVFFAGLAGGIFAITLRYIDIPSVFNADDLIIAVTAMIFGGVRTIWGPSIAAILFTILADQLRATFMHLHTLVLGFLMIVLAIYIRGGFLQMIMLKLKFINSRVK
jgi:branched-chain amino acid transport system permease protein